jgi:hypothetical protein
MSGKGSARRPCLVSRETYESAWDAIFTPTRCSDRCKYYHPREGIWCGIPWGLCLRTGVEDPTVTGATCPHREVAP